MGVERLVQDPSPTDRPAATDGNASSAAHGVVVWSSGRGLLRAFRPQVWVVLQDVAFDAVWRDSRLVAATSARRVAEHLGIDPGTAAGALRVLRDRGVVELIQSSGAAGRFGLAVYVLRLPQGLEVLAPAVAAPCADLPCADRPCADLPHAEQGSERGSTERSGTRPASADEARPARARRRAAPSAAWSQAALDLGVGES